MKSLHSIVFWTIGGWFTWVGVAIGGSALIGAGTSIYGANKQAKANASAQQQNAALQAKQNQLAWQNYLIQRGILAPTAQPGEIPSSNFTPVNTRLPLWATTGTLR